MTDLAFGAEFPTASREDWLKLVDKALKGADFDKALVSTTYDGLSIAPLYTAEDVAEREETPGAAPFTRGAHGPDGRTPPWQVCQIADHPDPKSANAAILEDLERGATAIAIRAGKTGVRIGTNGDLETLLDGVMLDLVGVHLDGGSDSQALAGLLLDLAAKRGSEVSGTLGIDPIGALDPDGLSSAADFAARTAASYPKVSAIRVDTRPWHMAGATEVQEIAAALATGVSYLRALEAAGLDLTRAASQIGFLLTTDADFFSSIGKLRAARRLWAKVTAACGIEAQPMALAIETAERMMTRRDPWVNMLRTTVACFAAGIAGAETVIVRPYNSAAGLPDGFARRIARNTQIILQEESSAGRVLDPAGGSWYVEHLTNDLERAAWALFQEIEAEGGIVQSMKVGKIQKRVAAAQAARAKNIARRKDPLTGLSEFARPDEPPVEVAGPSRQEADMAPSSGIAPLPRHPLGEAFERLRERTDGHTAAAGRRPAVFLSNLGTAAAYTARSTFARNFFGAGGIEAVASPDCLVPEDAVEAWRESSLPIAVLCSSDAVYGELAAHTARALQAAGAAHIYLAGHPGETRGTYEGAGIETFIHVGCNLVEMLDQALSELGVAQA